MWRLSKVLDISSAIAWVAPDLLKALAILSDRILRRSTADREDLKPSWKSEKGNISPGDKLTYYLQVFERLYQPQKEDWQGGSFLAVDLSLTFFNTGTTDETFQ